MNSSDESANSARTKSSAAPTFHSLPYQQGTAVTAIHLEKNLSKVKKKQDGFWYKNLSF